jgi:hypothetical protein
VETWSLSFSKITLKGQPVLKKDITFEDVDGNEVTETFYFNLNRAEMLEMELRFGDKGLEEHFREVVASNNRGAILDLYKYILCSTVGRREGKLFIKNEQITNEFLHGGAYSQMFMDLFNNPTAIVDFFRGVLPTNMQARYDTVIAEETAKDKGPETTQEIVTSAPTTESEPVQVEVPHKIEGRASVALPPGGDGNVVSHEDDVQLTAEQEQQILDDMFADEKPKAWNEYTRQELLDLPTEEFKRLLGKDKNNVPRGLLNLAFERRSKGIDK